ncbi:RNA polymerase sigma factor [Novosphingobium marinum]|uniref:RNA polymerase sigma factor n=1 Tax=Novosphingobium marinum TaxID=1514948 RepID=UPI0015CAD9F9|nr:RNA polymerase sigma factor [Novosphingobium marinum]
MAEANPEIQARLISFLPRLRRFCHGLAGTREKGDDLLQSTVERALSRIDRWKPDSDLESWMFKMASNLNIDLIRSERRRGVAVDIDLANDLPCEDGLTKLESRSEIDAVGTALEAMPEEMRQVLCAVVIDGQSYKDTAELFDIPIGTVMSRVSRARKFIERHLASSSQAGKAA